MQYAKLKALWHFLPLLILIIVVVYLGFINSTAEVYLDLETDLVHFKVPMQNQNSATTELMAGVLLDSLQFFNCDLEMELGEIRDAAGHKLEGAVGSASIMKKNNGVESQVILNKYERIYLKSLSVGGAQVVSLALEKQILTLTIDIPDTVASVGAALFGEIGVGKQFSLSGRNIKIDRLNTYYDYEPITIATDEWSPYVSFRANSNRVTLQMFLPPKQPEGTLLLL